METVKQTIVMERKSSTAAPEKSYTIEIMN